MRVSDVNAAVTLLRAREDMAVFGRDLRTALRQGGHLHHPVHLAVIGPIGDPIHIKINCADGLRSKAERSMTRKLKRLGVVDA